MKTQRIRDPIHGLILFDEKDPLHQLAWDLINTREFQRLRRIRQLGFSEFVYPGATHTRFAHCVGVFHTARELLGVLRAQLGKNNFDRKRANIAACAALLHDLGHGPFSHTFESVMKAQGFKRSHEDWTASIIQGKTEVRAVLEKYDEQLGPNLVRDVSGMLKAADPSDVYAAIVSSQFDADRLDYIRRDRYMTGTHTGTIDFPWLMDCLLAKTVTVGIKGENDNDFSEPYTFFLSEKGLQAAEGYLLGRFHLYSQVYMHKTTRAAEKMLEALLKQVAECIRQNQLDKTSLLETHPLVVFLKKIHNILDKGGSFSGSDDELLESYLALDDMILWSSLSDMSTAGNPLISNLSSRILNRDLYKCFDVGARLDEKDGQRRMRFKGRVNQAFEDGDLKEGIDVLIDEAKITAYKRYGYEEDGALQKVLIRRYKDDQDPEDIGAQSNVVKGIGGTTFYRLYASHPKVHKKLKQFFEEAKNE